MQDMVLLINEHIVADIQLNMTQETLQRAILYALDSGKRWRPIIFLAMFESSLVGVNLSSYPCLMGVCLFLEYIHTASLILDDMPMMDNDDFRRDKLTLHKMFDEATCKLAALHLLLLAQKHLGDCIFALQRSGTYFGGGSGGGEEYARLYRLCNEDMYNFLGPAGLCAGQFMDLHFPPGGNYLEMIKQKTSSLFILAFKLGYRLSRKCFVGGNDEQQHIEEVGTKFGYLYQILDDIEDYEQDLKTQHNNNYLFFYDKTTVAPTVHMFYRDIVRHLNALQLGSPTVKHILFQLQQKWLKNKSLLISIQL
jgi:geranylgeranyl diphosphate synthase type II